jgi:hypothetical protein
MKKRKKKGKKKRKSAPPFPGPFGRPTHPPFSPFLSPPARPNTPSSLPRGPARDLGPSQRARLAFAPRRGPARPAAAPGPARALAPAPRPWRPSGQRARPRVKRLPPPPSGAHAPGRQDALRFFPNRPCEIPVEQPPDARFFPPVAQLSRHEPPLVPRPARSAAAVAEVSSFPLSSLHRSPPRCSLAMAEARLSRPGRPHPSSPVRLLPEQGARAVALLPSSLPPERRRSSRAPLRRRASPLHAAAESLRARRTPSTLLWLAMVTESPSPTSPMSLQPTPVVRLPSPCLGLAVNHVVHVKSRVRSASPCHRSHVVQLVHALAFACAQCVDRTPSTFVYRSSTPSLPLVYPSSTPPLVCTRVARHRPRIAP